MIKPLCPFCAARIRVLLTFTCIYKQKYYMLFLMDHKSTLNKSIYLYDKKYQYFSVQSIFMKNCPLKIYGSNFKIASMVSCIDEQLKALLTHIVCVYI